MKTTTIKLAMLVFLFVSISNCGSDKKENKTNKESAAADKLKAKQEKKKEEQAYYKDAIEDVLNSTSEYAYFKSDLDVNTFIKGNQVFCFLDTKNETEEIYNDIFFVNVYTPNGREPLSFEFMDFEKDDIKINGIDYMFAVFNVPSINIASSIQIGQYSKDQKAVTWKLIIPKGRFHK